MASASHSNLSPSLRFLFVLSIFQKILQKQYSKVGKKGDCYLTLKSFLCAPSPQLQIFHNLEREDDQIDWMMGIREIAGKRSKLS